MPRSKNHHFVPKVMQKPFAAQSKLIWYSTRNSEGLFGRPELKSIGKTFRIRDYYTVLNGDNRSDTIEKKFYGPIDDYLGRLLPNVFEAFDRREIPTFTSVSLDSIRKVILEIAKRTPDFIKKHSDVETGRQIVEASVLSIPTSTESARRSQLLKDLQDPQRLKDYGRDVRVRATIRRSLKIEDALQSFSVRWAVSETRHSYILSSMMAYRIGNGGSNGFSNPNMEIWMPISPKISLVLAQDPMNSIPLMVIDTPAHIRQVNEYAVQNSEQIASHSRELLESLIGKAT